MPPAIYFPDKLWLSKPINFTSPSTSTWILTQKIHENCDSYDEAEAKEYLELPTAGAIFACHNAQSPGERGFVQVEMQIPYQGTEFLSPSDRQEQASEQVSLGMRLETDAYKLLYQIASKHTSKLIGTLQEIQASDSFFVPRGNIQYLAYTAVPGIRLGNGLCHVGKHGRYQPDGLFWDLGQEERREIRAAFEEAYNEILFAGVRVASSGLKNLYWDRKLKELYVDGEFRPWDADIDGYPSYDPIPFGPKVLNIWGLALPPSGKINYDVAVADLEISDWIL